MLDFWHFVQIRRNNKKHIDKTEKCDYHIDKTINAGTENPAIIKALKEIATNIINNRSGGKINTERGIEMVGKIIIIVIAAAYVAFNCIVSKRLATKEMANKFIKGQNVVGRIATNIFYAPAWLLKGIKYLAVNLIK